ncbi:single-stranded-DNA-specific exonuclease RecJ [Roseisolibacter sp. H3M3-2]|uniref:single-stranded-DNA-specific exonuclease RecJ n=1 Tax=Roseisolibacter sp. H3M3-2 TaxID=3031323 RepID=UPI0023DA0AAF|nr:single-stranded-DNA-specific exonuclease RecJ [Roseisolibacter sp. H3M3-2]MDF1502193.1 single-stranded-DNA-specific exonuclease RecJ [Roseisolibacter sp. H3M3-2]
MTVALGAPGAPALPRARPAARWVLGPAAGPAVVAGLAHDLRLPDAVCRLLATRGHDAGDAVRRYLRPRLEQLHAPSRLDGVAVAAERLARAVRAGETVLVHGDYDVDGMCSTALMTRVLRALGGKVVPFIPHRLRDGYDLTDAGVRAAADAGAAVVLTCDCGTSAHGPVASLCAAGIDVIVSDHHLPGHGRGAPSCFAVLNPNLPDGDYPEADRGLCAAGVAFKLALATVQALGQNDAIVWRQLDLVALATIADIAPLRGENRVLARYGLKLLGESGNAGVRALVRASGLEGKPLTAGRVGFILAPRLNAVGRLGSALRGVELLTTDDDRTANAIARELEELNRQRQELDRATLDAARRQADRLDLDRTFGLVLSGEGWHPGVIGIVASRIVEEFARPTVMVAVEDGVGKGSGRSIPRFDLHAALSVCDADGLFQRFGGHRAAAGVTLDAAKLPAFARRFDEVARERLTVDDLVPELRVDLELPVEEVTDELEAMLRHFEPHGLGNAAPVLMSRGVELAAPPRRVGDDGIRLALRRGDGELGAIGWGLAARAPGLVAGQRVDVAFRLERDEFRGVSRLQAKLADVVPAGGAPVRPATHA